jgi:hypothetical protein
LAPKQNGQTNGNGASVGVKAPVAELHDATARASRAGGGTELALLARVREA